MAAADSVTVKASSCVPLLPSATVASATDSVGTGTGSVPTAVPLMVKPEAVVPPLPGVAWKPNDVSLPPATLPFQSAFFTT